MFRISRAFVNEGPHTVVIGPRKEPENAAPPEEAETDAPPAPAPAPAPKEPVMSEEEARALAQGILDNAQKQADQLLDEAAEQAQGVREEAWQAGYQEGQSRADKEAANQRKKQAKRFDAMLEGILKSRDDFLQSMEKDILNLAVDIARKIVHTEIDTKDEAFLMLVQNALNHMKSEGAITLRLGPEDYKWYGEAAEKFLKPGHSTAVIHVVEDPILLHGSCILESEGEAVNAGVETQLASARLALMEEAEIGE